MYQIDVEMRRDVNASNHSSDLPETADFFSMLVQQGWSRPMRAG